MIQLTRLFIPVLFLFLSVQAMAQTSTVSPYSRFGPGDVLFNGFAHQRAMGGTSIAEANVARLNCFNPASYGYDTLMVFEFGISGDRTWLKQGDLTNEKWNARIDYLVLGMPIWRNKMGLAFGMLPFNGIGYSIETNTEIDSANSLSTKYEGKGGYNKYFIGTGLKVTKNLSLGVNASYLFGSMQQSRVAEYSDDNFMGTRLYDDIRMGDFLFDFGAHWRSELKNDYVLTLGATYGLEQELKARRALLWETFRENSFGVDVTKDTIEFDDNEPGTVVMPMSFGFGAQLAKGEKWLVRSDFRYQQWSNYESFKGRDSLSNSYRISLGGQYTDDPKSPRNIQYRAGVYFNRSYLQLRNTEFNEVGVSAGLALNLMRAYASKLNFTIEAGQRGTETNNLIRERFVRFSFGLTFNENWFQKRKYE
jgi:hypothetical protein